VEGDPVVAHGFLQAPGAPVLLQAGHLSHPGADGIHEVPAQVGQHHLPGGGRIGPFHGDGLAQLLELGVHQGLQGLHLGLQFRVAPGQPLQVPEILFDPVDRAGVRVQVAFVAGDQVSSLPGLRLGDVLQGGLHGHEEFVGHGRRIGGVPDLEGVPVGQGAAEEQHADQDPEGQVEAPGGQGDGGLGGPGTGSSWHRNPGLAWNGTASL
jgi:hypothetical protein